MRRDRVLFPPAASRARAGILLCGILGFLAAPGVAVRAGELHRKDVTLFAPTENVAGKTKAVSVDARRGVLCVSGNLPSQPGKREHVIYSCPAEKVCVNARLSPSAAQAFIEIAASADQKEWKPVLAGEVPSTETHWVAGGLGIVDLRAAGPHSFIRLAVWRDEGSGLLTLGLQPLGERVSREESGAVDLGEAAAGAWIWAKMEDLPGTPPGKSDVLCQYPEVKQIQAVKTGALAPGIYSYMVRPYVGKGGGDLDGAESPAMAELVQAGIVPSLWFRRYCGENGRIVLDWSGEASKQINEFWKVVHPPAKTKGPKPSEPAELDPAVTPKAEEGYEVWRQEPGARDYRLVARVPDPRTRSWGDGAPVPANAPSLKKAEPKDINKVGAARAMFGTLAPGTCYYRLASIFPEGMTEAGPPLKVALEQGSSAAHIRIVKCIGACGYAVWRSTDPDRWENTLVAVLDEDEIFWTDTGLPASRGTSFTLEVRAAKAKDALQAAPWRATGPGHALKLEAGERWIEYRVTGKTDFVGQRARTVRVLVSDKEPKADDLSPRLFGDVGFRLEAFMVPGEHAWASAELFPREAAAVPDARQVVTANAFQVTSRGGTFFTRNFDVQAHNPLTGRWETIIVVRNNKQRSIVVTLERPIAGEMRSFGPYQSDSGAYSFDPAPSLLPLLLPAAMTDVAINGCVLHDRPLERNYIDGFVAAPVGESEIACQLTGLRTGDGPDAAQPASVTLAVALAEGRKGEYQEAGRQELALAPGETKPFRHKFSVPRAGEFRVQVTMTAGKKTYYRFAYWLRAGNAMELERLHPSYRGDLFASDPDRTLRFRLMLSAVQEAKVACELTEPSGGRSVWSKAFQASPGSPWVVEVPVAGLRCGRYCFRADAGELGKVQSTVRLLPKVEGMVDCYLRSDGVMVRDGKPFLPLSLHSAPSEHAADPLPEALLTCGVNSVAYTNPNREGVDLLAKHGILYAGGDAVQRRADSQDWDEQRMTARILGATTRNQLFWFAGEEMDIFDETTGRARKTSIWWEGYLKTYNLCRELMPFMPVYALAFDGNSYLGPHCEMALLSDIYGLEPYLRPSYDDDSQERSAGASQRRAWIAAAVLGEAGRSRWTLAGQGEPSQKAVWASPLQAWDTRCWQDFAKGRVLSLTEHRFMAYDALLLGATGLGWWGYHWDYFHIKFNPLQWESLRAVIEELAMLAPAWLAKDVTADARLLCPTVDMAAREHEGKAYLFVANHRCNDTVFAVQCPEAWKKIARYTVVNEDRECEAKDGVIRERIGPFGVRIYTNNTDLKATRLAKMLKDPRFNGTPSRSRIENNLACEWNGARASGNYKYFNFDHNVFANDGDPETAYITPDWFKQPPAALRPYTLTITLKDPAKVERIIVRTWRPKYWPDPVEALENYDLEVCSDKKWDTIAEARKNEQEVRTHEFPARTIEALRLKIHKGLYVNEIEAYGPDAPKR